MRRFKNIRDAFRDQKAATFEGRQKKFKGDLEASREPIIFVGGYGKPQRGLQSYWLVSATKMHFLSCDFLKLSKDSRQVSRESIETSGGLQVASASLPASPEGNPDLPMEVRATSKWCSFVPRRGRFGTPPTCLFVDVFGWLNGGTRAPPGTHTWLSNCYFLHPLIPVPDLPPHPQIHNQIPLVQETLHKAPLYSVFVPGKLFGFSR